MVRDNGGTFVCLFVDLLLLRLTDFCTIAQGHVANVGSKEHPIDLTRDGNDITDVPIVIVEAQDTCCFCLSMLAATETYYMAECGHLFCYSCMFEHKLLNRCGRCNQVFMSAVPVKIAVK